MATNLIKCPQCGEVISSAYHQCPLCNTNLHPKVNVTLKSPSSVRDSKYITHVPTQILNIFAWVELLATIIAFLFISLSDISAFTFGIAIAILLQGVFVCALFLVIASVSENTIAIRRLLEKEKDSAT